MNKFVIGALAFSAAGTLAFGNNGAEDWSSLDREIESLATSLAPQGGGFTVDGYLRSRYANSGDVEPNGAGNGDLSGFNVDNARVQLNGSVGDYGAHISFEGASGAVGLYEAYATFAVGEQVTATWGQFRVPLLWSSHVPDTRLLFLDRTINGGIWYNTANITQGVKFDGSFEQVGWTIAIQNGADGAADELAWTGKVTFNAMGEGVGMQEGAYGAGEEGNLTVGLGYLNDDGTTNSNGTALAIEAAYTVGAFSLAGEFVDYDTDLEIGGAINSTTGVLMGAFGGGGASPFSITGSYLFGDYEGGVRFEDLDDTANTTNLAIVVNRYIAGHDAKWQLQYNTATSDAAANEANTISLGLTVSV
jgi:hypothetical protein